MNIQVTNLDTAYTSCEGLNTLVTNSGTNIIGNLGTNITNLKAHWIGSDATVHINNLISVYNALVGLVTDAKAISSAAGNAIVAMQTVRRDNGGAGSVGAALDGSAPESEVFAKNEDTTEYKCDPLAANDLTLLEQICTDFSTFKSNFSTDKDELMNNWLAGANREGAVKCFEEFMTNAEEYSKKLTGAKDNLAIAVSNLSQL